MKPRVEQRTVGYVDEVSQLLWPRSPHEAGRALVALPSLGRPRMLVPAGPPRVAAAAVRSLAADRSVGGRVRREGVATALRLGAGRALLARGRVLTVGASGVDEHLSRVLGRQVVTAMLVGAPRANRKPVLALLGTAGQVVGFAKVGSTPLTRGLVGREADALASLAERDLADLRVPRLLHRGRWNGLDLAVQSPLDTARATPPRPALLHRALAAVASSSSGARPGSVLGELAAWRATVGRLAAHADAASDHDVVAAQLHRYARRLEGRAAGQVLASGAWHGDLTPWNIGVADGRLLVWDWERYEDGVPVGFDALHHELAVLTQGQGLDHEVAARRVLEGAGPLTAPLGVPLDTAGTVALAYLITLGARYLVDGQRAAGHRSGQLERWLVPLLAARLGEDAGSR
jgi:hypothetical protein